MRAKAKTWWMLAAVVVVVVGLAFLPTGSWIRAAREWLDGLGPWRGAAFVATYVLTALLFVPASALTIVAGALFGPWLGTGLVAIASTLAALFAFVLARHVARRPFERMLRRHPKFEAIDRAIGRGGFKVVVLLRLSPLVPFSVSNYLFGLTPVGLGAYAAGTALGSLPGTFLYVYLGYLGAIGLGADDGAPRGPQIAMFVAGVAVTVAWTIVVARLARRELRRKGRSSAPAPPPRQGDKAAPRFAPLRARRRTS